MLNDVAVRLLASVDNVYSQQMHAVSYVEASFPGFRAERNPVGPVVVRGGTRDLVGSDHWSVVGITTNPVYLHRRVLWAPVEY